MDFVILRPVYADACAFLHMYIYEEFSHVKRMLYYPAEQLSNYAVAAQNGQILLRADL